MSWSSEPLVRGRVLNATQVTSTPADLGTVSARAARSLVVSPELVESATHDGYEAGHANGFERGFAEGLAQARAHSTLLTNLIQRLSDAADALMMREATALAQVEDEVVATAFRIAEAIVGPRLERPETRGLDAIARALELAPDHGLVVARLNPDDLALIESEPVRIGRALEMMADPQIAPGDCVLEVGSCRVDARIEPALARVREVLS